MTMNVGQLRRAIADLPEDMLVFGDAENGMQQHLGAELIHAYRRPGRADFEYGDVSEFKYLPWDGRSTVGIYRPQRPNLSEVESITALYIGEGEPPEAALTFTPDKS